jgi:Rha family phage regulatory protein
MAAQVTTPMVSIATRMITEMIPRSLASLSSFTEHLEQRALSYRQIVAALAVLVNTEASRVGVTRPGPALTHDTRGHSMPQAALNSTPSHAPVVTIEDGETVTTSINVAAVFDKRHDQVIRSIDLLIEREPFLALHTFVDGSYKLSTTGDQEHRYFTMTRDGFTLVGMGFSGEKALKFKLAYIDAFNRMEAELRDRPALPDLNDPAALRQLLLSYSEKVLTLEDKVSKLEPQAQIVDRIANSNGSLCITDAAKTLGIRPTDLFKYLRHNGWIYMRLGTSHDVGYQNQIIAGNLEHKVITYTRPDGEEKTKTQVRVTPKGLTVLAKLLPPTVSIV